jgi:hypothetical protein
MPKSYPHFKPPATINATQNNLFSTNTPVITGLSVCAVVLTIFNRPMTAVRSAGFSAAARKAERGAASMDCVQARRMRSTSEGARVEGRGRSARKIEEGRWVNTIVFKS